jgi:thiol-disulfide isomerase/thioredoxin
MRCIVLIAYFFVFAFQLGCRPAAAPVAIGNSPVSVNGVRSKDAPSGPAMPLSEMSWTNFDGNVSKVKDLKGKAVLLDFWATNCPPCIEEIPHLLALKEKYGDELVVVGMHVGDDEDRQKVPAFIDRLKITYPLAYPDDALTRFVFENNSAIPQTMVIDRNGAVVKKIVGFNKQIKNELDAAVEKAIHS